jgi:hypothetical protein
MQDLVLATVLGLTAPWRVLREGIKTNPAIPGAVDEHGGRCTGSRPQRFGHCPIVMDIQVGFRRPEPHKRAGEDEMTSFELLF